APQGSITIAGSGINASGGEDGGGTIDLEAGGNVTTGAPLNVNGGGLSGDAGSVTVFANGSVSIGGAITGNAGGSVTEGGGAGADVEITAVAGTLTVTAGISADSGVPDGDGGAGNAGAGPSSLGPTGENPLQASGQMTVGGTLTSTANRLEYLDPAKLPQVATGAVVAPPPAIAQNSLLPPCGTPPARCGN